jgi:transcriptional regulator with GAF, ATPase, and Fis domain
LQQRQHHRSAFSRAYALHETLLKARVIALFTAGQITVKEVQKENGQKHVLRTISSNALVQHETVTLIDKLLNKTQTQPLCQILTGKRHTIGVFRYRQEIEALRKTGSTQRYIASRFNTTESNLSRWMKKYGLKRRKQLRQWGFC